MNSIFPKTTMHNLHYKQKMLLEQPQVITAQTYQAQIKPIRKLRFVINGMSTQMGTLPNVEPITNVIVEAFRAYDHGWIKTGHSLDRYFPSIGEKRYEPTASILITFYHTQDNFAGMIEEIIKLKCINMIVLYPISPEVLPSVLKFREMLNEQLENVRVSILLDQKYTYEPITTPNIITDHLINVIPKTAEKTIEVINNMYTWVGSTLFLKFDPNVTAYDIEQIIDNVPHNIQLINIFDFKLANEGVVEDYFYRIGAVSSDHREMNFDEELDMTRKAQLLNKRIHENEGFKSNKRISLDDSGEED